MWCIYDQHLKKHLLKSYNLIETWKRLYPRCEVIRCTCSALHVSSSAVRLIENSIYVVVKKEEEKKKNGDVRLQRTVCSYEVHTNVPVRAGWLRIKATAAWPPRLHQTAAAARPPRRATPCDRPSGVHVHAKAHWNTGLPWWVVCSGIWLLAS